MSGNFLNTQEKIHFAIGDSSLGLIVVGKSHKGLCSLSLGDDSYKLTRDLQERFPRAELIQRKSYIEKWLSTLIKFIDEPSACLEDIPIDERGTHFQLLVWQTLREIPMGSTASYSDVAKKIGLPKSARAVAQACAANPLAIVTPCHRVIKNNGMLSGYRWGKDRKQHLLQREKEAKHIAKD
jgi:AraC family transcriptional regulator, regulatory protein of adaptative response / methylated-DNA-[protein]-cysteine methyltransferase